MNKVTAVLNDTASAKALFEELSEMGNNPLLNPNNAFELTWEEFEEGEQAFLDLLDFVMHYNPVAMDQVYCLLDYDDEGVVDEITAGGYSWVDGFVWTYKANGADLAGLRSFVNPLKAVDELIKKVDSQLEANLTVYSV